MKDKTTAGILALLLGAIGVHRFYLGQAGKGLMYLLFCWTFVPAIIALIDGIIFLTMDVDAFNKKYNMGKSMPVSAGVNTADELEKLHALKEKGVLTAAEYDARKAKLL
jgi:TM2 domain-containing membrane protein YozV